MTDQPRLAADGQRDALRARIEAAERRNEARSLADQARETAEAAAQYTRQHPLAVIGGALALGVVIGLLTRPGRRIAGRALHGTADALSGAAASASSGVKNVAARGGTRLGGLLGEAAVSYAMTLMAELVETARTGQERASDLGEAAGEQARKLRDGAADAASSAATGSRAMVRSARDSARAMAADLARKTRR